MQISTVVGLVGYVSVKSGLPPSELMVKGWPNRVYNSIHALLQILAQTLSPYFTLAFRRGATLLPPCLFLSSSTNGSLVGNSSLRLNFHSLQYFCELIKNEKRTSIGDRHSIYFCAKVIRTFLEIGNINETKKVLVQWQAQA